MLYDVIVIGLGVTGASSAWRLAERGMQVLAVDRFSPPHTLGSSHGGTRITRHAYFEQPRYVPLVRRADELWASLEAGTGARLRLATGGLNVGPEDGRVARGAAASAREYGVAVELLDAAQMIRRFPGVSPGPDMVGVYEPGAGLLFPERCVSALHAAARAAGATLVHGERVTGIDAGSQGLTVHTASGRHAAGRVVLAAGSWLGDLASGLALPLEVERQVTAWFAAPSEYAAERCPVTLWELPDGPVFYTCPDVGDGLKAALHHGGATVHPDLVERSIGADDLAAVRARVRRCVPAADGAPLRAATCLYTNTPDGDFILDAHPQDARIVIASACSGHGFKFGPAIGEIVTHLVQGDAAGSDTVPFRLGRFGAQPCDAGRPA